VPPRTRPFIPIRSWTEAGRRVRRPGLQGTMGHSERNPPKPGRSGVRPERALEANSPTPRAQRESSSFPEPPLRAQPTKTRAERCQAGASLGGEHSNPSRTARKLILPRASSASATHQNPGGAVSGRSEPWRRTLQPLAHSAKADPSQSLLSERRPDTAEPPCLQRTHPAAHHHSPPLTNPTRSFSPAIRTLQSTRSYESLRDDCPRLRPQLP
jgi:hypothetical protein